MDAEFFTLLTDTSPAVRKALVVAIQKMSYGVFGIGANNSEPWVGIQWDYTHTVHLVCRLRQRVV